jgi:hypothetical protein
MEVYIHGRGNGKFPRRAIQAPAVNLISVRNLVGPRDEIQEHELMDAPDINVAVGDQMPNNIGQLGFVELFQPAQDPVFMQRLSSPTFRGPQAFKSNPEAIRLWAIF